MFKETCGLDKFHKAFGCTGMSDLKHGFDGHGSIPKPAETIIQLRTSPTASGRLVVSAASTAPLW